MQSSHHQREPKHPHESVINRDPPWIALGWSGLILLLFFTAQMATTHLMDHWLDSSLWTDAQRQWGIVCSSIISSSTIGLVALWRLQVRQYSPRSSFKMPRLVSLLFYLLLTLGIHILIQSLDDAFDWQNNMAMSRLLVSEVSHMGMALVVMMAVVVTAPLFEELLFRGYLFDQLRHSILGNTGALLIPNVLWSFIHIAQFNVPGLLIIFGTGLIFSWARLRTESLITPIAMHMVFNTTSLILVTMDHY